MESIRHPMDTTRALEILAVCLACLLIVSKLAPTLAITIAMATSTVTKTVPVIVIVIAVTITVTIG